MDPAMVQLFAQFAEMQKQLAEGLHQTNQNLALLVTDSERRQEVILKESREGRQKHWDDGEKKLQSLFWSCERMGSGARDC